MRQKCCAAPCRLAMGTEEHHFDTLYHAVALEFYDTALVTADERY
jgi:hypothetical protein